MRTIEITSRFRSFPRLAISIVRIVRGGFAAGAARAICAESVDPYICAICGPSSEDDPEADLAHASGHEAVTYAKVRRPVVDGQEAD